MPLGVSYDPEDEAYNFALYSKHATSVTLLLFSAEDFVNPTVVERFDPRLNKSGRVWHRRLPRAVVAERPYYAYLIDGPREPSAGHRFDPAKLLLDPYARAVFFPPNFSREAARKPGSNTGRAALGVILPEARDIEWFPEAASHHTHDAIIYELHVRGFTKRASSGVAPERRGTFAGLVEKIPYLKELGITAVELMPVFQFDPQEGNYWGYMPLSFFALHDYAAGAEPADRINEFRCMVRAFHEADIELILDVVYSHTAEGDASGPCYSFRGIDNTTYYLLQDDRSRYRNDSGTGNVLHTANRYVAGMVMDSLHYWASEFHVDGFRFDLASLFTRRSDGSIDLEEPPVLGAIQTDPELAELRLIAEAWDVASYQLGRLFPATTWLQWNGRFRDDVRSFVRGEPGYVERLMRRLCGSDDLFPDTLEDAYHAFQSVNFVSCHDGFCLRDLVSYNEKHNEANGEDNRDGSNENRSWNCGWEGDEGVPERVIELRLRQAKNLFCLLMLANGTPMFGAGDEFLNTQQGNNNPYNQDNETTWLDWDLLETNATFFRFCKAMIAFRKAHPSLSRSRFWREDVRWFGTEGPMDLSDESRTLAFLLAGGSEQDRDLYVMINAHPAERRFLIQGDPRTWKRVVDTSLASPQDITKVGEEALLSNSSYVVGARSVVVLLA
ncbi:MAG: glycogen debranching enzyme GlgX [Microvirga sp.]|nr:glycogen debranching enzyme GlgX [Microvirga sp.]